MDREIPANKPEQLSAYARAKLEGQAEALLSIVALLVDEATLEEFEAIEDLEQLKARVHALLQSR